MRAEDAKTRLSGPVVVRHVYLLVVLDVNTLCDAISSRFVLPTRLEGPSRTRDHVYLLTDSVMLTAFFISLFYLYCIVSPTVESFLQ